MEEKNIKKEIHKIPIRYEDPIYHMYETYEEYLERQKADEEKFSNVIIDPYLDDEKEKTPIEFIIFKSGKLDIEVLKNEYCFSEYEIKIFTEILNKKTRREIADQFYKSRHHIDTVYKNMCIKLDISSSKLIHLANIFNTEKQ